MQSQTQNIPKARKISPAIKTPAKSSCTQVTSVRKKPQPTMSLVKEKHSFAWLRNEHLQYCEVPGTSSCSICWRGWDWWPLIPAVGSTVNLTSCQYFYEAAKRHFWRPEDPSSHLIQKDKHKQNNWVSAKTPFLYNIVLENIN